MTPERRPRRSGRAGLTLVLALGLTSGCTSLQPWLDQEIFQTPAELSFDRPSDLLPPEGVRVTATEDRQISLSWAPVLVGDVAGYAVTHSRDAGGPYLLVGRTHSRFETIFTDSGETPERLGDGQTYYYRIHPYDSAGRVSRSHAYLRATTDPRPELPTGLRAYSNLPRRVVLEWEPSADRSVTGYAVLRSPTVAGPWERIVYVEGRLDTVHEDQVPGDLRVMYYRISALNRFGGESDMTRPIRAVTKAEPLPPMNLELEERILGQARLRWAPNVEEDLTTYQVWRANQHGESWSRERLIAEVTAPATQLVDAAVGCGESVRYRMRAIDADQLVSGFSEPLEIVGEDIGLETSSEDEALQLRWDPERTRRWPSIRIIERRIGIPDRILGEVSGGRSFSLPELKPGRHRLAVVLTRPSYAPSPEAPATSERLETLACEITLEIP